MRPNGNHHIVVVTIGTRGDVFPFIALGLELRKRGYDFTICAPQGFQKFVTNYGIDFHSLGDDFDTALDTEPIKNIVNGSALVRARTLINIRDWTNQLIEKSLNTTWQIIQQADLVLYHPFAIHVQEMAAARAIPAFCTAFQPIAITKKFPLCVLSARNYGSILNRASYNFFRIHSFFFSKSLNDFRRRVLKTRTHSSFRHPLFVDNVHIPTLMAYSPALAPPASDWPRQVHVTGAWFMKEREWEPDEKLERFLEGDLSKVYFGFGSAPWNAKRNTELIVEAVKLWGGRALIATGWGGINGQNLPDGFHAIDYAPHERLFPLMDGLFHHGGAGTTQNGLKAGCPTLVAPIIADGLFWGDQVRKHGAGPRPTRLQDLTPASLAKHLEDLTTNRNYAKAAKAVGAKIAAEDGTKRAIEILEDALTQRRTEKCPHQPRRH